MSDSVSFIHLSLSVFILANHSLSAEELPTVIPDSDVSFVVQSEGANEEVRVLKIVLSSRLQRNLSYNSILSD